MKKLIYLCSKRSTLELGHVFAKAIENNFLDFVDHNKLEEMITNVDDITIFQWVSKQTITPKKYERIINTILQCQTYQ